ncbi:MAG: substrate-binding domain-containing protein [Magnetospirillum sp.]|nr:substrate-binding domain-containing protein [Magnetospirillum sp.]
MKKTFINLSTAAIFLLPWAVHAEMPPITGKPVIDTPKLLEWQADRGVVLPNLDDPTADTLYDLHAGVSSCDIVLSTEGNYHPALHDIWPVFLAKFKDKPLRNWFYTTSPPVVMPQTQHHSLEFGNFYSSCMPSVAVGGKPVIDKLAAAGLTDGAPLPLYVDQGEVILVKKGNPRHIHSVWDLGRKGVRLVTPNPTSEAGAFKAYAKAIYAIAKNDPHPPRGMTADKLINIIFNGANHDKYKWLAGARIHHRDEPWSVAYGRADAAVILYHLGVFTKQSFPDTFDVVPLGGTVSDPRPLPGTTIGTRYVVALKGEWTPRQLEARNVLVQTLMSDAFTKDLETHGLKRPDNFMPMP